MLSNSVIALIVLGVIAGVKSLFLPKRGVVIGELHSYWRETGFGQKISPIAGKLLPCSQYGLYGNNRVFFDFKASELCHEDLSYAYAHSREISLHYEKFWFRRARVDRVCLTKP